MATAKRQSFAANAVGFYLQIENQLSGTLKEAEKDYTRFVKSLTRLNEQAVKSATKGFSAMNALVQSFQNAIPKGVKGFNPISRGAPGRTGAIKVSLSFTQQDERKFAASVSRAVVSALNKVKFGPGRAGGSQAFTPAAIKKAAAGGSKDFNTAMTTVFKTLGSAFNVMSRMFGKMPHFQSGGVVGGPPGKAQTVVAHGREGIFTPDAMVKMARNLFGAIKMLTAGVLGKDKGSTAPAITDDQVRHTPLRTLTLMGTRMDKAMKGEAEAKKILDSIEGMSGELAKAIAESGQAVAASVTKAAEPAAGSGVHTVETAPAMVYHKGATKKAPWDIFAPASTFKHGVAPGAVPPPLPAIPPPLPGSDRSIKELIRDVKQGDKSLTDMLLEQKRGEAHGFLGTFLSKILGTTQFLAMNSALSNLGEHGRALSGSAHGALGAAPEKMGSFVEQYNQMNRQLGLSRGELRGEKIRAAGVASTMGGVIGLTDIASAEQALLDARNSSKQFRDDFEKTVALMHKGTQASEASVAEFGVMASKVTKLSSGQTTDMLANMADMSKQTYVSIEDLTTSASKDLDAVSSRIGNMSAAGQQDVLMQMTQFHTALASQSQEAADAISDLQRRAMKGDFSAQQGLSALGTTADELLTKGGQQKFIANLQQTGQQFAGEEGQASIEHVFGPTSNMSASSFSAFAQSGDKMSAVLNAVNKNAIGAGQGLNYLTTRASNATTWFEKWEERLTSTIASMHLFGIHGVDVINFFHEFNPMAAASYIYLAKDAVAAGKFLTSAKMWKGVGAGLKGVSAGLGKAAGWLFGDPAAKKKLAGMTAKAVWGTGKEVASDLVGAEKVAIKAIPAVEEGIKDIGGVAGAATAAASGTGIQIFLTGIANGLKAFCDPQVLGGVAVLVGAVGALAILLATAIRIVGPEIMGIFEKGFEKVLDTVSTIVTTFMELAPTQMFAIGLALLELAVAIPAFGAGLLVGSNLILASLPSLIALGAALYILAPAIEGEGSLIGGMIDELASAFTADTDKVNNAVAGIEASARLLGGLLKLSIEMEALGLMSGGMKQVNLALDVLTFGFLGDPISNLVKDSKEIAGTVNTLAFNLNGIDDKAMAATGAKVASIGQFMEGYTKIACAVQGNLGPAALLRAANLIPFVGAAAKYIVGDPMQDLKDNAPLIRSTVLELESQFRDFPVGADFAATGEKIASIGKMMDGFAKISEGMDAGHTGEMIRRGLDLVLPGLSYFIDPKNTDTFRDGVAGVKTALLGTKGQNGEPGRRGALEDISDLANELDKAHADTMVAGLANITSVLAGMGNVADAMNHLGENIKSGDAFKNFGSYKNAILGAIEFANSDVIKNLHSTSQPILTKTELQQAVQVSVSGTVEADDATTHELLTEIAMILAAQNGSPNGNKAARADYRIQQGM